ncbi:hypothetical protein ZWY2020_014313 [Hordeum vulgare]|nr:hypothetical protein ZWY2020_014313 [Hordeum vulgare]
MMDSAAPTQYIPSPARGRRKKGPKIPEKSEQLAKLYSIRRPPSSDFSAAVSAGSTPPPAALDQFSTGDAGTELSWKILKVGDIVVVACSGLVTP